MKTACIVVQTSVSDQKTARQLAHQAVELGLAACAQLLGPGESYYRWQGQVEQADEYYLAFKTSGKQRHRLIDWLTEQHPYDVPEIIWHEYAASAPYMQWLYEATSL